MGDFAVSSIRKWLPIPQGGVLYTKKEKDLPGAGNLEKNVNNERSGAMIMKNLFLRGMSDCNAEYRRIFQTCEEKLDHSGNPMLISDFAEYLVSCFDIREIRKKRKENFEYLSRILAKVNLAPISGRTQVV